MKRLAIFGLSTLAVLASVSLTTVIPFTTVPVVQPALAQSKGIIQLKLSAEKQLIEQDKQGNKKTTWQPLKGNVLVKPGDVMRYSVVGENSGDRPVKNLVLTQPIPRQMIYVLKSANVSQNAQADITYSIDNGKSYVAKPTIPVKLANGKIENQPAPATAYTHIRWKFISAIAPKSQAVGNYLVKVR